MLVNFFGIYCMRTDTRTLCYVIINLVLAVMNYYISICYYTNSDYVLLLILGTVTLIVSSILTYSIVHTIHRLKLTTKIRIDIILIVLSILFGIVNLVLFFCYIPYNGNWNLDSNYMDNNFIMKIILLVQGTITLLWIIGIGIYAVYKYMKS
jgi:hypothetical protein